MSTEDVSAALAEISELQGQVSRALEQGETAEVERLMAQLAAAERRRNRLVHSRMLESEGPRYAAEPPLREQVIRTLKLLTRPASLSLISDVARARWGQTLSSGRMASLRRDEMRSFRSASGQRPVYVVPALSWDRFAPARGVLTLSSWSFAYRILAPASPRVDLLVILSRLIEEMPAATETGAGEAVSRVIWRLARTVPGAVGRNFDLHSVVVAARTELEVLDGEDRAEREEAAERGRERLSEFEQLFGSPGLRSLGLDEAAEKEA